MCPVQSFPDEMWEKIISVNLSSCFYMIKNALPHMQNNNFGRIINVSSVHGKVGSINKSAYSKFSILLEIQLVKLMKK